MTDRPKQTSRLVAALPESSCDLMVQAAALQFQSVSEFVVNAASEAAEQAIAQQDLIQLTPKEQNQFAEALINPPPVTDALKRAFKAHRELIDRSEGSDPV